MPKRNIKHCKNPFMRSAYQVSGSPRIQTERNTIEYQKSLKYTINKTSKRGRKHIRNTQSNKINESTVKTIPNVQKCNLLNAKYATLPPLEPSRNVPTHNSMSLSPLKPTQRTEKKLKNLVSPTPQKVRIPPGR